MSQYSIDKNLVNAIIARDYPEYKPDFIKHVIDTYRALMKGTRAEVALPNGNYFVVGDLHGDYDSLLYIMKIILQYSKYKCARIVFLGDYVDRGKYSVQVLVTLMIMKIVFPGTITLLRGNHEYEPLNDSFRAECHTRFGEDVGSALFDIFTDSYAYFPIACTIANRFYCVHGGVPLNVKRYNAEVSHPLPIYIDDEDTPQIMCALWDDPMDNERYMDEIYDTNDRRGEGTYYYGKLAADHFMKTKGVQMIIRGHEVPMTPIKVTPDNSVVTIFSSINYMDKCTRIFANFFYINETIETSNGSEKGCTCFVLFDTVRNIDRVLNTNESARRAMTPFQLITDIISSIDRALNESKEIAKENASSMGVVSSGNQIEKMCAEDTFSTSGKTSFVKESSNSLFN